MQAGKACTIGWYMGRATRLKNCMQSRGARRSAHSKNKTQRPSIPCGCQSPRPSFQPHLSASGMLFLSPIRTPSLLLQATHPCLRPPLPKPTPDPKPTPVCDFVMPFPDCRSMRGETGRLCTRSWSPCRNISSSSRRTHFRCTSRELARCPRSAHLRAICKQIQGVTHGGYSDNVMHLQGAGQVPQISHRYPRVICS